MGKVTTPFKRAWLRRQYAAAEAADPKVTLLARLTSELSTRVDAVATGSAIASTAGNGHSMSFSKAGEGGPGPEAMAELAEEMIRRHDIATEALAIATPTVGDNLAILNKMLASLWPATSLEMRFTNLRQNAA